MSAALPAITRAEADDGRLKTPPEVARHQLVLVATDHDAYCREHHLVAGQQAVDMPVGPEGPLSRSLQVTAYASSQTTITPGAAAITPKPGSEPDHAQPTDDEL
jgi:hypothetical protein